MAPASWHIPFQVLGFSPLCYVYTNADDAGFYFVWVPSQPHTSELCRRQREIQSAPYHTSISSLQYPNPTTRNQPNATLVTRPVVRVSAPHSPRLKKKSLLRQWIESELCSFEVPSTALLQGVVKLHPPTR